MHFSILSDLKKTTAVVESLSTTSTRCSVTEITSLLQDNMHVMIYTVDYIEATIGVTVTEASNITFFRSKIQVSTRQAQSRGKHKESIYIWIFLMDEAMTEIWQKLVLLQIKCSVFEKNIQLTKKAVLVRQTHTRQSQQN